MPPQKPIVGSHRHLYCALRRPSVIECRPIVTASAGFELGKYPLIVIEDDQEANLTGEVVDTGRVEGKVVSQSYIGLSDPDMASYAIIDPHRALALCSETIA